MVEKINEPRLRFMEFKTVVDSGGFKKFPFLDLFLFSTGKNIKQNEASPKFEIPCVRYGELYHMYGEVITKIINRTNLNKSELTFSKGDEILLPSAGEDPLDIGSASALTVKNVAIGRTINVLRPKLESLYSPIYASHYINLRLKKKISSLAKGVSISNVYNSDLKTLEIVLPSLPEQQKIASFLSSVDERIELLEQKKEKLEVYKKGVMQQIFSQRIRFRQDDGAEFPDWEERKLGEVAKFYKGKNVSKSDIVESGNLPCIRYGELYTEYSEVIDKVKSRTNLSPKNLVLSHANDVIIPASGETQIDIACAACVLEKGIALGGDLNIIRSPINGVFLSYYLNHKKKYEIARLAQGISVVHLYPSQLQRLNVEIPVMKEQLKIVTFLRAMEETISKTTGKIEGLRIWKKGLLQQMFV